MSVLPSQHEHQSPESFCNIDCGPQYTVQVTGYRGKFLQKQEHTKVNSLQHLPLSGLSPCSD